MYYAHINNNVQTHFLMEQTHDYGQMYLVAPDYYVLHNLSALQKTQLTKYNIIYCTMYYTHINNNVQTHFSLCTYHAM